jgi:hypothetical protein
VSQQDPPRTTHRNGQKTTRRAVSVLAVALLLTTAGCGGVVGNDGTRTPYDVDVTPTPTPTETATQVPTETTTQTPERAPDPLVEKASEQSIKLRGLESYTIRYNYTSVGERGVSNAETAVYRVDKSQRRELIYFRPRAGDRTVEGGSYQTGEYVLKVSKSEDGPEYERDSSPTLSVGSSVADRFASDVTELIATDFQRNGTGTVDGERMTRYTVEGTEAAPPSTEDVLAYQVTVLVDDEGLIRRVEHRYVERTDGNETVSERTLVTLSGIGSTTVERPEWVDEALAATGTTTPNRTTGAGTTEGDRRSAPNRTTGAATTAPDRRSVAVDPRNVE